MKEIKELSEVIHLYLGCECMVKYKFDREKKSKIIAPLLHELLSEAEYCRPIVRRLSSMTEDIARELLKDETTLQIKSIDIKGANAGGFYGGGFVWFDDNNVSHVFLWNKLTPDQFVYLLSKGFWLFSNDAFEQGLIIDADIEKKRPTPVQPPTPEGYNPIA